MIEIEVGDDDVAHVHRIEAERADLRQRRLLEAQLEVVKADEQRADPRRRLRDIAGAKASIDEHQPGLGLDQQAVADQVTEHARAGAIKQPPAGRATGAAVKVMDAHQRCLARRAAVCASMPGVSAANCRQRATPHQPMPASASGQSGNRGR